jgi:GT2 family glycosyltransferase
MPIIRGKKYKISVLILTMESEIESTIVAIETLIEGIEDGVTISVLLNGGTNPQLKELLSGNKYINYYESKRNLGVAGGRNFLLRTPESRCSDIIMFLDNDVVCPLDYVRSLAAFLITQENVGIAGAMVANIRYIPYDLLQYFGHKGMFGNKIFKVKCKEVRKVILSDLKPEDFFHIGMYSDYYTSYFSVRPQIYGLLSLPFRLMGWNRSFSPVLKFNTKYLRMIKEGVQKYLVSNVVGCSQAFRRELIERIGYLNEMFNPYGFEDVDFCIRALRAGYKNYIDTSTWLLHGTDSRSSQRNPNMQYENQFRCLTILAKNIFDKSIKYKPLILKLLLFNSFAYLFSSRSFVQTYWRLKAGFKGISSGLKCIKTDVN